ncbi:alkaline phosphatase family protein [Flectobacillus sp. DC10W]|uniref:Alkaline phosphatase family protein n=1 Tax=Flectobacillus longus TaxID=2984207 RepID=A0ABT6YU10_9BACT|nr:alkaline phosphatase PafA [Flectobacillus longus]MDI9866937.1 alkaline phosphatase family protein [Flectobacillus longus]
MNKKLITLLAGLCAVVSDLSAQTSIKSTSKATTAVVKTVPSKPKLVIGIVVDQMRYDYLYRYSNKYTAGGFKRLMGEGFNCRNHHYDYVPTVTAAGHAAIFTGSVPAVDGIIGNEWFDSKSGRTVYCVEDSTVKTVGASTSAGLMSPKNLLVSTITDQVKIAQNHQSKTIGIALKDRGAILPAGHTANAAYWFDSKDGFWISSSFYMNELPNWVKEFNAQKNPQKYVAKGWNTLLPIEQYTESTPDDQPFEGKLSGEQKPVFPHELAAQAGVNLLEVIRSTPYGNSLTKDFAVSAIQNEQLGKGASTDFLTVSFSSTDYVGHAFGPNSIEAEDTYIRLDREIASLLSFLDTYLGKDNILVFLSADHGVADVPGYWQSKKLPAGTTDGLAITNTVKDALKASFGEGDYVRADENNQIYLNHETLKTRNISRSQAFEAIKTALLKRPEVANVIDLQNLANATVPEYQIGYIKNGYNIKRSGDILYFLNPGWFTGRKTGTTHGSVYRYDTHIPLLWYGWKIKHGETSKRTNISDIAPTVADLLDVLEPNGTVGNIITDVVK